MQVNLLKVANLLTARLQDACTQDRLDEIPGSNFAEFRENEIGLRGPLTFLIHITLYLPPAFHLLPLHCPTFQPSRGISRGI
jgi:hypothetical protein